MNNVSTIEISDLCKDDIKHAILTNDWERFKGYIQKYGSRAIGNLKFSFRTENNNYPSVSPFWLVCRSGNAEAAKLLLDGNPDINESPEPSLRNCLMVAIESGSFPMVKLLLEKGVDINKQDAQNFYPDHLVCLSGGNIEIATIMQHYRRESGTQLPSFITRRTLDGNEVITVVNNKSLSVALLSDALNISNISTFAFLGRDDVKNAFSTVCFCALFKKVQEVEPESYIKKIEEGLNDAITSEALQLYLQSLRSVGAT